MSKAAGQRRLARCLGIFLTLLLGLAMPARAAYVVSGPTAPYTWIDISASGTNVSPALTDDSVSGLIPIGFTFNFGGTNYTQLRIGSNGWIFFGTTSTAWNNTPVATAPVNNVLLPYWDDLNPNGVAGRVKYQTLGTAPDRQFVISYLAVPTYPNTGSNTLQVVLNENGSFRYNYQSTNDQGAGATIGYRFSPTDQAQFSYNTASVPNARTLTWTPLPSLTHLKSVSILNDPVNGVPVQDNTLVIVDPVPANTEFFSGNVSGGAPYQFVGSITPASGLTCPFTALNNFTDCVDFSSDGGTTWTYVPNGSFDAAVTHIRFRPSGRLNGDAPLGTPSPGFSVQFRVRIK